MDQYLYTVTIEFEDRTFAVEQAVAEDAERALIKAILQAEALLNRDRSIVETLAKRHTRMFQVADRVGVWNWHKVPNDVSETEDVFGGVIMQTDKSAPTRQHGT